MDLDKLTKQFDEYVSNYDMSIKEIKLKYHHSYKVMELMKELSDKLNLSDEETRLAQVIGLLHDIGRFEQFREYNTFNDNKSEDHADESVIYLFDKGHIRDFIKEDKYDEIIKVAIKNHNKKYIDSDVKDEKQLFFAKMIRDCDKIDIYRVMAVEYELEFNAEDVSEKVLGEFNENGIVDVGSKKTKSEVVITNMGFLFDINFEESFDLLVETDNFDLYLGSVNVNVNSEKLWKKLREICFDKINRGVENV